jgi:uncharacterized protein DUF6186
MGLVVWALVFGVVLGYQGFCLTSTDDRWPALSEIVRDVMQHSVGRWVLFALWLWLGWHLFVRGWRFFLRA